jgi:hypothetical protein
MFRRGRRLFSSASIGLVVVGILHSIGSFAPRPPDPARAPLEQAMRADRIPLGFWQPSTMDILMDLTATMSVLLFALAAVNLVVAKSRETSDALVRRCGLVSALAVGAMVLASYHYKIPPPFMTLAIVEILFVLSLVGRSSSGAAT